MILTGLHILLTYECNLGCDHCFVWGSNDQSGTLTLPQIKDILAQAKQVGTIEWIYFEGGEPGLYYPTLLKGVQLAAGMGFRVGMVSNGYWATSEEDALNWLAPFRGLLQDLSISSDHYHWFEKLQYHVQHIQKVAEELDIPLGVISIARPEVINAAEAVGKLPEGESGVMYRGRAAVRLAPDASQHPWEQFTACPYEDLLEPGRVHLDPLGNLHICQGIIIGNMFSQPLIEILASYDPHAHPIVGPLLAGGPVELALHHHFEPASAYADACHLCYSARLELRQRFPLFLGPGQMYGDMPY